MNKKRKHALTSPGSKHSGEDGAGHPDEAGGKHIFQGELLNRLKKIEGQVRGIQKMIQECRSCGDIVIQLAAVKSAVNRVGITVLACHLADKIDKDLREEKDMKESLEEFMAVFKKFS
ncbi:MAG: metal-sensitive transcriptional regulator [Bacillota bacterium]